MIEGIPEGWTVPERGGPWLYGAVDAPPASPQELELISTPRSGEPLRLPAWLPAGGLPTGTLLATRMPEAQLLPLVAAPQVALDESTFEPWWWVGVDPVSGEAREPLDAGWQGEARVWVDLPAGDYVLVDGQQAWGAHLE